MSEIVSIQWFPGHMAKTRRLIKECLSLVDIVVELVDSRIPTSSRNPEIDKLIGSKPRLILLNKCDTSDTAKTNKWCDYYKNKGIKAIQTDCRSGKGLNKFLPAVREVLKELLEAREKKGMAGRAIRMMIVGVPNCGKSSLINRLAGSKRAKVEDRPGVTRGKQWISLDNAIDLLDMPGMLWPKFEDKIVGERLAFTGAVKDDVIDIEFLAIRLLETLSLDYANLLVDRYGVEEDQVKTLEPYELLEVIAKKRGMLISGGGVNTERAAIMVLDEFRSGKIGRISLETPV